MSTPTRPPPSATVTPPADADASVTGDPYLISTVSNHLKGPRVLGVNIAYVDGHVERQAPDEVHPYYCGNWWNWR